eukprot:353375-Chlamydomonas_euryale.AAC.5
MTRSACMRLRVKTTSLAGYLQADPRLRHGGTVAMHATDLRHRGRFSSREEESDRAIVGACTPRLSGRGRRAPSGDRQGAASSVRHAGKSKLHTAAFVFSADNLQPWRLEAGER